MLKTKLTRPPKRAAAPGSKPPAEVEPVFSKGQKWQLLVGQAEIVHVGKILIDYRLHSVPPQKRTPIRTDLLSDFTRTIKKNNAKLLAP